jgi:hypothetical protein
VVAENPIYRRLTGVIGGMTDFVQTNRGKADGMAKMAWVMSVMAEEVVEELKEMRSDEELSLYLAMIGEVISWIGHGDMSRLPEFLKPFAMAIEGDVELVVPKIEAIS